MSVTIKDVAKAAGVSYSTVSKALRNSPLVKEPTKQHIIKTAKELGYKPNAFARGLVSKRSNTIGIVWPTIEGTVHSSLITNVNRSLESLSYTTLISINEMSFAIDLFNRYRVDAILVFDDQGHLEPYDSRVPVVTYGLSGSYADADDPVIDVQRKKAVKMAAAHLHEIGHSRISYIGADETGDAMQKEKYDAFKSAVHDLPLTPFASQFVKVRGLEQYDGYMAAKKLLEQDVLPTAVISGSHDLTKGVIQAFREAAVKVPDDISIISYDNIPTSQNDYPFSTVGVPLETITETLIHTLIRVIEHKNSEDVIYLEPELVLRSSIQPLIKK